MRCKAKTHETQNLSTKFACIGEKAGAQSGHPAKHFCCLLLTKQFLVNSDAKTVAKVTAKDSRNLSLPEGEVARILGDGRYFKYDSPPF